MYCASPKPCNLFLFSISGILFLVTNVAALNPSFNLGNILLGIGNLNPSNSVTTNVFANTFLNALPGKSQNISWACYNDTVQWMSDLLQGRSYALQMLDSFAKLPSAMSKGHVLWFGGYDSCLSTKLPPDHISLQELSNTEKSYNAANYCLVRLKLTYINFPINLAFGVCLPKTCSARDADIFLPSILHVIKPLTMIDAAQDATLCESSIPSQTGFTVTLVILAILLTTAVWATVVHVIGRQFDERWYDIFSASRETVIDRSSPGTSVGNGLELVPKSEESQTDETATGAKNVKVKRAPLYMNVISSCSMIYNTNYLFSPPSPGHLAYIDGLRVFSIWWIILGQTFQIGQVFYSNHLEFIEDLKSYAMQVVLSTPFAVDTFFLISGLVVARSFLKKLDTTHSCKAWLRTLLERLWRLTPLNMMVLLIFIYIVPYLGDGPYPILARQEAAPDQDCKNSWWTNLGYFSNFYPNSKLHTCMPWTQFLSANMQLFLITPLLLLIAKRSPKLGAALLGLLIVSSAVTVSLLVWFFGLPLTAPQLQASLPAKYNYSATYEYLLDKPYVAGCSYFTGVLLAVIFANKKSSPTGNNVRMRIIKSSVGWCWAIIAGYFAIFGLYYGGLDTRTQMDLNNRTVYAGLGRLAWSFAIGWVIYSCQYGHGSAVKNFLSLPVWTSLSRLTYTVFLIHFLFFSLYFTSLRTMVHYNRYQAFAIFLSQVVSNYLAGYAVAIIIEFPFHNLGKILLPRAHA